MEKRHFISTILIIASVTLIVVGLLLGGYTDCVRKGSGICLECLGLGR